MENAVTNQRPPKCAYETPSVTHTVIERECQETRSVAGTVTVPETASAALAFILRCRSHNNHTVGDSVCCLAVSKGDRLRDIASLGERLILRSCGRDVLQTQSRTRRLRESFSAIQWLRHSVFDSVSDEQAQRLHLSDGLRQCLRQLYCLNVPPALPFRH